MRNLSFDLIFSTFKLINIDFKSYDTKIYILNGFGQAFIVFGWKYKL